MSHSYPDGVFHEGAPTKSLNAIGQPAGQGPEAARKPPFLRTHKWRLVRGTALLVLGIAIGTGVNSPEESSEYKSLDFQYSSAQTKLTGAEKDLKEQEDKVAELDSELSKLKSEKSGWQDQGAILAERDQTIETLNGQITELSTQRDECQATLTSSESSNEEPATATAQLAEPAPAAEPAAPSAYYKNCSAARAAGAAPVHVGNPGYGSHLDRDGDGIGCE